MIKTKGVWQLSAVCNLELDSFVLSKDHSSAI